MRGFLALLKKEAIQMLRDKGTLRFALILPIFQLVLFGLIDTNVRHVPTVVFDQSRTEASRDLIRQLVSTSTFEVQAFVPSREALRREIVANRASVGVEIPPDYDRRLLNGQPADVLVLIDGSDSTISAQTLSASMVRFMAACDSRPELSTPSPRRMMREKASMTRKPRREGLAMRSRQLLVPRSRAP